MTVIVPAFNSLIDETNTAVKLAMYAQIVGYSECAFFGVNYSADDNDCRPIWTLAERVMTARALREAQEEIEEHIRFPLRKRWIAERRKDYTCVAVADWTHIIAAGVKGTTTISSGEVVNHATDPAIIGPIATTVTEESEIAVYHPGTEIEIYPSAITIAGGNVTIEIPRCRMVTLASQNNDSSGLDYANLANFEATVDVVRVYNDESTNAILHTNHRCNAVCASQGCSDYTQGACMYLREDKIGSFGVYPATYSSGAWARTQVTRNYMKMQLNYYAGVDESWHKWTQLVDAVIRLAHSKMPKEPCGCDPLKLMWYDDRKVPDVLTRERINCPFGLSNGAWRAWKFTQDMMVMRLDVL